MNHNIPVLVTFNSTAADYKLDQRALSKLEGCSVSFAEYPSEVGELAALSQPEKEDKAISLFAKVTKCETFILVMDRADEHDAFAFMLLGAALMLNKRTIVIGEPDLEYDLLLLYPTIEVYPSAKRFVNQNKKEKLNAG